ncbi:maleate cis-trans isomerase family protein [Kribbella monticola]|uniref:maleate cis-trans isomerase family protein n=1 Tax=Kribbella monticola TaxID=2185285 RepID=UPI000DD35D98|nr:maleate cis-trans isomerase [Kribbella monticola]
MDKAALTVGVLTPHAATGPEVEIPVMASATLEVKVARIPRHGDSTTTIPKPASTAAYLRAVATPAALRPAVESLRDASVDAIAYASTTSGYAIGPAAEADLTEHLRQLAGVPVVTSGLAATQALKTFGIRRITLVHPPWFEEEMAKLGARYFQDQDIEVVTVTATSLPQHPDQVRPEQVIAFVSEQVDVSTEAVFIAGNGFRAAAAIEELERRTGRLILEANQVLLWSILAATGTKLQIEGNGTLFRTGLANA